MSSTRPDLSLHLPPGHGPVRVLAGADAAEGGALLQAADVALHGGGRARQQEDKVKLLVVAELSHLIQDNNVFFLLFLATCAQLLMLQFK